MHIAAANKSIQCENTRNGQPDEPHIVESRQTANESRLAQTKPSPVTEDEDYNGKTEVFKIPHKHKMNICIVLILVPNTASTWTSLPLSYKHIITHKHCHHRWQENTHMWTKINVCITVTGVSVIGVEPNNVFRISNIIYSYSSKPDISSNPPR